MTYRRRLSAVALITCLLVFAGSNASADGSTRVPLSAAAQIGAMNRAISAAPVFFAGYSTGCTVVTPLLADQAGSILAGNFRDPSGACYIWLNLERSSALNRREICKTTLHELGHLDGLPHSPDRNDVMYAPFVPSPIPPPCLPPSVSPSGRRSS